MAEMAADDHDQLLGQPVRQHPGGELRRQEHPRPAWGGRPSPPAAASSRARPGGTGPGSRRARRSRRRAGPGRGWPRCGCGCASSFKGRMGSAARLSCHRNAPTRAAPTTNEMMVTGLAHPSCPASTRPKTMAPMPTVQLSAPKRSKWPCRDSVSARTMRPIRKTAIPMGTFTNMTQRHETSWVSSPPAMRPMAPPAAETVVKRPMARTRAGPSGNETVSKDRAEGAANAAPSPGGHGRPGASSPRSRSRPAWS